MTEIGENGVKSAIFAPKTRNEIRRIRKNALFRTKKCAFLYTNSVEKVYSYIDNSVGKV